MSYTNKLQEMGIVASRIEDLDSAMNQLHKAISRLDLQQLRTFGSKFGILGHLDMYAREEGVRNVAVEMYNQKLKDSIKNIDFDEFPTFSDKLFCLTEEAAEVGIPGAQQLCRSLTDLRKLLIYRNLLFSRIAQQAENIAQVHGSIDRDSLKVRITSKYKDAFRHLDEEQHIGTVETLRNIERHVDEEHGDSGTNLLFIRITLDQDTEEPITTDDIKKAIRNTYGYSGCGHEHDCCGCISQSVNRMKRLRINGFNDNEVWAVSVSWYRNV